jgi:hypothetical protein
MAVGIGGSGASCTAASSPVNPASQEVMSALGDASPPAFVARYALHEAAPPQGSGSGLRTYGWDGSDCEACTIRASPVGPVAKRTNLSCSAYQIGQGVSYWCQ